MNKQLVITILSLLIGAPVKAFSAPKGKYYFRPAFQKKLKRVQSLERGFFKTLGLSQESKKKKVFIDGRKIYWGKLEDLISSEEGFFEDESPLRVSPSDSLFEKKDEPETEDSQAFAFELRQELTSFAKHYGLKIVWKKTSRDMMDGTAAFIAYWDEGLSQVNGKPAPSFEELCLSSARTTNRSTQSDRGGA